MPTTNNYSYDIDINDEKSKAKGNDNKSKSSNHNQVDPDDYAPKRFGLKYNPPTIGTT